MATQSALEPQVPAVSGVRFLISPRRIAWAFAAIITVITALSVAEQYVIHVLGRDDLEEFLIAVDVDAEANIPHLVRVGDAALVCGAAGHDRGADSPP